MASMALRPFETEAIISKSPFASRAFSKIPLMMAESSAITILIFSTLISATFYTVKSLRSLFSISSGLRILILRSLYKSKSS